MSRYKKRGLGQNILEYAVLLGIVGLALGSMQLYFRRGIQAAIKISADQIGSQKDSEEKDPEKGVTAGSVIMTTAKDTTKKEVSKGGGTRIDYDKNTSASGMSISSSIQK